MDSDSIGVLVPIFVPISMFAMVFGIVYLHKRERMAMIERGMDPRSYKPRSQTYNTLKWGLLLIGAGLGLFLAYILDHTCLAFANTGRDQNPAIYFALIAIFGGAGLFISYLIEKKDENKATNKELD
ncbi:DUF6249 domain-containing protein [Mucilaginibacter sp. L196]|uniref:DUF6249 domain-containing protein n=1 Tax=Mucilaginibacter sp. L196 TaxID=1641870 RepID=UPI00131E2DA3|nr:DUF6249 domain-containing protein [Mucilaginibacter sp. L196]